MRLLELFRNFDFKKAEKFIHEHDFLAENTILDLANRCWFIWFGDGVFKNLYEKHNALINRNVSDQDQYMREYISENKDSFKGILVSAYPNREKQIEDAFAAHNAKIYYASIPVFIALSEGIGRDIFPEVGLFEKYSRKHKVKPGKPKYDDLFDLISSIEHTEASYLKPLRECTNLTKTNYNPTTADKKDFHRHLIMHGNSDAYGSEENSLKAISLVYFVHCSLTHLKTIRPT